jgi:hypothetical protein
MVAYLHIVIPLFGLTINIFVQVYGIRTCAGLTLLKSVMIGFACGLISVVILECGISSWLSMPTRDILAEFVTNLLIYMALGYCYFHFINLGETARRIRIVREIYEARAGLSRDELLERYQAQQIVDLRLRRLLHNQQILERDGRYYIGSPVMLGMAKSITFLKRCLLGKSSEFD